VPGPILGAARIPTAVAPQFIDRCQLTDGDILATSQAMLRDNLWIRGRPESSACENRDNQCVWPEHWQRRRSFHNA